jgi:hypothetical protein|tara:strand:+ start:1698 stop:1904 length:207 start_codon:yes stop_codon:yes gene_type:complete
MPDLTDVEIGKMIQAVDQLSKEVDRLTVRLDQLESQLDKGKGVLLGVFVIASGLGAAASTMIQKMFTV